MITIKNPDIPIMKVLGTQKEAKPPFRFLRFLLSMPCAQGILAANLLTGGLYLFAEKEYEAVKKICADPAADLESEPVSTLLHEWILVPECANERQIADGVRSLLRMLDRDKSINSYTILPTTACNARCAYCYEAQARWGYMDEKTAEKLADFITDNANGNKVTITWFGGEPTLAADRIDLICRKLKGNNTGFTSRIVSNGLLLTKEMAVKARDEWNVTKAQITLDGTAENYNRIKNYHGNIKDAFSVVVNNIEDMLETGLRVAVRLNVCPDNAADMHELAEELAARFRGKTGISIYSALVFEDSLTSLPGTDTARKNYDLIRSLDEKLYSLGYGKGNEGKLKLAKYHCMADNPHALTVSPDGGLGKCEHETWDDEAGSIFGSFDVSKASKKWQEMQTCDALCNDCALYPTCVRQKNCFAYQVPCGDERKRYRTWKKKCRAFTLLEQYNNGKKEENEENPEDPG